LKDGNYGGLEVEVVDQLKSYEVKCLDKLAKEKNKENGTTDVK